MSFEFIGVTKLPSADAVFKTYYVWAYLGDDDGKVEAMHYGISSDLQTASGVVHKRDLDTDLRKKLWRFIEDAISEGVVIEPFEDTQISTIADVLPFKRRH